MSATWQPQNGNGNRGPTPHPYTYTHTNNSLTQVQNELNFDLGFSPRINVTYVSNVKCVGEGNVIGVKNLFN